MVGATQINLTWNASSDNVGVTGYRVYRCTGTTCTPSTQIATSTTTSYSNTGLTALTTYRYRVRAVDAAGNLSANSSIVTATTPAVPDTTAPTIPAGLAATVVSATQINLSWTAATDNVGVTGYQLERCQDAGCAAFALIATVAGTTFNNTGLTASTSYSYRVRASDGAGNLSGYSNVASATTPIPDTTPPTAPAGLAATAIGATLINLGWTAATDDVAVSGYQLERCQGAGCTAFALIATVTGVIFNDTGRSANTSYSYRVRATDATGNIGEYSNIASATTAAIPSYTTNFDLTENPISEGGVWRRASTFWTNVSTANGIAFGTNGITNDYDDSYALLSGFGPDQQAEAVVFRSPNLVRGITHEIELLLRFSDDANSARGYECLFNYQGDVQLVKWNGAPGDFTPLTIAGGAGGLFRELVSGDVIKATAIGNVISLYINGVLMGQATDSTFATGQPGISFFTRPGGNSANLGITSYTVSSNLPGSDTTPPAAPTGLAATAVSATQINLTWTAATDNIGVTGYRVERCAGTGCTAFALVATSAGATFNDTGLTASTSYSYRVRATDAAGNLSGYSNVVSATTQAVPDTTRAHRPRWPGRHGGRARPRSISPGRLRPTTSE